MATVSPAMAEANRQPLSEEKELLKNYINNSRNEGHEHEKLHRKYKSKGAALSRKGLKPQAEENQTLADYHEAKSHICYSAAAVWLVELNSANRNPKKYFDLHGLRVTEATIAVDHFIDKYVGELRDQQPAPSTASRALSIITGRGLHSPNGVPKLKPAIIARLQEREIGFWELDHNPGCLVIKVFYNTKMTCEV